MSSACLASGFYYLSSGGSLSHVASAVGGVTIFVASGKLTFDDGSTLTPELTGPQAGITIFVSKADHAGVETSSADSIRGVIYAPGSEVHLLSRLVGAPALRTDGVDSLSYVDEGAGQALILG
jgi:hypothetical protein